MASLLGVNGVGADTVKSSGMLAVPAVEVKCAVWPNVSSEGLSGCSEFVASGVGEDTEAVAGAAALGETDEVVDAVRFSMMMPATMMGASTSGPAMRAIFWGRFSDRRGFLILLATVAHLSRAPRAADW